MPAYDGLVLRHGDSIYTGDGSSVAIALCESKYAVLEGGSGVELQLYKDSRGTVTVIDIEKGGVYAEEEPDSGIGHFFSITTADGEISGTSSAYRVEFTPGETRQTTVQAIKGSASVYIPKTKEACTLSEGTECRIDRYNQKGASDPFFSVKDKVLDPYSLPDRYIELSEDGVFDPLGNIIDKAPSGDLSLKEIYLSDQSGNTVVTVPEFDNATVGYVAITPSPAILTVTANHKKTRLEILCHTAQSIEVKNNKGTVTFTADGGYHAVSILVIAEDGSEKRFSVNIAPTE